VADPIDYPSRLRAALAAMQRQQATIERLERARNEPIAIVGLGCRFPGGASDPESFWRLLHDGVDAIREVPADRWDLGAHFDPQPGAAGKMYTRFGGFLDGVDQFDARFFQISRREAASMDPQQRLLMEVAWEALEDAGIPADRLLGSLTGVFVGLTVNDYAKLVCRDDLARIDPYYATGNVANIASGRLSYFLGLRGPSLTLDTACSSSLVAVHLACQSLRSGDSEMALAAGVNLMLLPDNSVAVSQARMLAADGRCKAFGPARRRLCARRGLRGGGAQAALPRRAGRRPGGGGDPRIRGAPGWRPQWSHRAQRTGSAGADQGCVRRRRRQAGGGRLPGSARDRHRAGRPRSRWRRWAPSIARVGHSLCWWVR
jgi:hypothetical protein